MKKNIVIVVLSVLLLTSNIIWSNFYHDDIESADSVAELEIKIRDKSIENMAEIIAHVYKDKNKHDLINALKTDFNTAEIYIDGDWVYFKNIKFQFIDNKLIKVL